MRIRSVIFWLHLTVAVAAGGVILILCASGAILVCARPLQEWSERAIRRPEAPPGLAVRLTLDEALLRAERAEPAWPFMQAVVSADPRAAITFATEDHRTVLVNPSTGQVQPEPPPAFTEFFRLVGLLHTRLNLDSGQPIAAAANVVLLVLALTGLCLWWPRAWRWATLRPTVWFVRGASGRAREWNWHNVFAIWFLPVLVVLGGTGVVLSYRSVNAAMFQLAPHVLKPGERGPRPLFEPGRTLGSPLGSPPSLTAFSSRVEAALPHWQSLMINFFPRQTGNPGGAGNGRLRGFETVVTAHFVWPPFTTLLVSLDPATGALRVTDTYAAAPPARRARMWVRLLHSGDALGDPGRIIAGLASLAGCILVYTGYAMALRRLFKRLGRA